MITSYHKDVYASVGISIYNSTDKDFKDFLLKVKYMFNKIIKFANKNYVTTLSNCVACGMTILLMVI